MSTERDDAERDAIASASARRDDEIDAEADESLRGMRSVWLAMRDEEPPSGGLAELMAAARSQAMAKRPAPWWQRALDALRRPPVLALASATILVAGAVVVGRQVAMDREPAAMMAPAERAPMMEAPHEIEAKNGEADGRGGMPVETAAPAAAEPPPPPAAAPAPIVEGTAALEQRAEPARKPTRAEPAKKMKMPAPKREALDDLEGGERAQPQAQAAFDTASSAPTGGVAEAAKAAAPGDARERAPVSLSAQLAACVRAARRGDCAETQRLFKELARASNAYAMRASKDPAIARCLPTMGVAR